MQERKMSEQIHQKKEMDFKGRVEIKQVVSVKGKAIDEVNRE